MTQLWLDTIEADLGQILLVSDGEALCALDFIDYQPRMLAFLEKRYGPVQLTQTENPQGFSDRLRAYLKGDLSSVNDMPVNTGGTPFQRQVWAALRSIPPGTVITYHELAEAIGKPTACRAVGAANGQNPVAIVLPCHRVIGANGSLTGYAGGLARKRWLLEHEGVSFGPSSTLSTQLSLAF